MLRLDQQEFRDSCLSDNINTEMNRVIIILYMYNHAGKPWKAQYWINKVLYNMYDTSPEGIIGNDDTGQMSAWFVFSALGFYPVSQGDGVYLIGTPIFKEVKWKHSGGTLLIKATNVSQENKYIQSAKLNGEVYTRNWLQHNDIFKRKCYT